MLNFVAKCWIIILVSFLCLMVGVMAVHGYSAGIIFLYCLLLLAAFCIPIPLLVMVFLLKADLAHQNKQSLKNIKFD